MEKFTWLSLKYMKSLYKREMTYTTSSSGGFDAMKGLRDILIQRVALSCKASFPE